jgi:hypothetical protein
MITVIGFSLGCKSDSNSNSDIDTILVEKPVLIEQNGSGGTLTVTDIPSEYDGKYAVFNASLDDVAYIRGYQNEDESSQIITLSEIIYGSVSIPLWLWVNSENSYALEKAYTGNDTVVTLPGNVPPCLLIFAGDMQGPLIDPLPLARIEFPSMTFSNGSAAISANAGTLIKISF